jgi:hypothetical protein
MALDRNSSTSFQPRPFLVMSLVHKGWRKGKGRYASVESAVKTARFWIDSGVVTEARVVEQEPGPAGRMKTVWRSRDA